MKKTNLFLVMMLLAFSGSLLAQIVGSGPHGDYVGSDQCMTCHTSIYNDWIETGHPYKFNVIDQATPVAPTYPSHVTYNGQSTWMDSLADGSHTWADIAGVIGGYGWKARFVGDDGHLIGTGNSTFPTQGAGHNQYNFFGGVDLGWSDYHPGDKKVYNYGCFKCHTTGGTPTSTGDTWLAGVDSLGTFSEGGIGCEACHGPGLNHEAAPSTSNISRVYEQAHDGNTLGGLLNESTGDTLRPGDAVTENEKVNFMCGTCHNRDYKSQINANGGYIKHHEQWDEFMSVEANTTTGHGSCITCHDPHKRAHSGWGPAAGAIKVDCATCHSTITTTNDHSTVDCIECHMPYAAKSGAKQGVSGYQGDVRSHLFVINTDTASMFTADGKWVKDDVDRDAALSPHFACLGCHNADPNDAITDKTIDEASAGAIDIHNLNTGVNKIQTNLSVSVYPNPTNGTSNISFSLNNSETVTLAIFNATGKKVYSLVNGYYAGVHKIVWDGTNDSGSVLPTGVYYIKLSTDNMNTLKKLVIMK